MDGERERDTLRRRLATEPAAAQIWSRLGKLTGRTGSPKQAVRLHARSLLCAPGAPKMRGRLSGVLQEHPSAGTGFTGTLLRDLLGPGDPALALVDSATAGPEDGRRLQRLLLTDPAESAAWSRLGKRSVRRAGPSRAARLQIRALLCAPAFAKARGRLSLLLQVAPDAAAGLSHTLLCDLLNRDDPAIVPALAIALAGAGATAGAGRLLRRSAVAFPGAAALWAALATMSAPSRAGRDDARRFWWRAWTAGPGDFQRRENWASRILERGDAEAATYPLLAPMAARTDTTAAHRLALIDSVARRRAPDRPDTAARRSRDLPLILISQIQRSGGSMLLGLFDGHPSVLAYPYELMLGRPRKCEWPDLDLSAPPARWMQELFEPRLPRLVLRGFAKPDGNRFARAERLPFDFDMTSLIGGFLDRASASRPKDQRAVMDRYFAAYFDAWHDCRPSGGESRIAAFAPRLAMHPLSIARYRRDYPDGHLVGCIRHPRAWLISAQRHSRSYERYDTALTLWQISAEALIDQAARFPQSTTLVIYENLVADPEHEMRRLAGAVGIDYAPSLLTPSVGGRALLPNSSFDVNTTGIHRQSIEHGQPLTHGIERVIATQTVPTYELARRLAAAT